MPPWFVITGGPSVGKTTIINELKSRGYIVVQEAAREVIDRAIKQGISVEDLRKDEKWFQEEVTRQKIKTESKLPKNKPVFLDRGMHDTIAYMQYYNFKIDDWIYQACDNSKYRKVFLLEPLNNFSKDYARVENDDFKDKIGDLLYRAYDDAGLTPEVIPPLNSIQRLNLILSLSL